MGKNLLVDGKSGINQVSPRYTFVKQGPVYGANMAEVKPIGIDVTASIYDRMDKIRRKLATLSPSAG